MPDPKKQRKNNHVIVDLSKLVYIIFRQTKQTTIIEYAYSMKQAEKIARDTALKFKGPVAIIGPQKMIFTQPEEPKLNETIFQDTSGNQPVT